LRDSEARSRGRLRRGRSSRRRRRSVISAVMRKARKFLPAETAKQIVGSRRSGRDAAKSLENLVFDVVTKGVVDTLETVEIKRQQNRRPAIPRHPSVPLVRPGCRQPCLRSRRSHGVNGSGWTRGDLGSNRGTPCGEADQNLDCISTRRGRVSKVTEYHGKGKLVSLDARELDHLTPLLGLIRDQLSEFGRRAGKPTRT
jgi:hypothetical protein